jgi:hypothetical protein
VFAILKEFKYDQKVSSDTLDRYFTKRFLYQSKFDADKYDWNPITQTQDCNEEMLLSLKVSFRCQILNIQYYDLTFRETFKNRKHSRVLVLTPKDELWKIDTIINNDNDRYSFPG